MNGTGKQGILERARDAAARGACQQAFDLLMEADSGMPLGPEDLGLLADAAYAVGDLDVTIETWERAHGESVRAGDALSAAGAAVRVAMHLMMDTGLMAPVRAWAKRTERLLDGLGETPVHAWLAMVWSYERLLSGDFDRARQWARRAVDVGTAHGDAAAVAMGRVAEARALIFDGAVDEGLGLLEDAAAATVSGELDPLTVGMIYCEVVCAWQGLAQYDLAEEWTDAYERWRGSEGIGSMSGRCRVHRAEILRLRGSSADAERQALVACEELRPYLRREFGWPLTELGRIRLQLGDLQGAEEAFLAALEAGWDPQPGHALLRLARGDIAAAAASIRDAFEHPLDVPSKELPPNTELRLAPLLEAQVEIAVAAGDLDRARWAADELERVAAAFHSKALDAGAALARGRVGLAEDDAGQARATFQRALDLFNEVSAPYEAAVARIGLAQAHRAEGNEDQARLEFRAAGSTFERVGALQRAEDAARARDGGAGHGDARRTDRAEPKPRRDAFHREGEIWSIRFDGRPVRVRDAKGLRYLARLLAEPGREFHVLDLVASERPPTDRGRPDAASQRWGDAGELLDARAKGAYKRRLAEIEDDIEEARVMGDGERASRAAADREFLLRELSRAVGLGGRDRLAGAASERARASVTRAIRDSMAKLRTHDRQLGEHLQRAIRTGTYCVYLPDPLVLQAWER